MKQEEINTNVQERLRSLEASQQIMTAFLFAVGETIQDKDALRRQFLLRSETLISGMLSRELQEDWIDAAISYREALLSALSKPNPS